MEAREREMQLIVPNPEHLDSYRAALERAWSPDNLRPEASLEELDAIGRDPERYLSLFDDREGNGAPVKLPDGATVARLPSIRRWMWDGDFCGEIGLRWQPGTAELPPTCLGHIGFSVVPWKRRLGHATWALAQMLPEATRIGLPFVELVTDLDNIGSQRVITGNGGVFVERFFKLAAHGVPRACGSEFPSSVQCRPRTATAEEHPPCPVAARHALDAAT